MDTVDKNIGKQNELFNREAEHMLMISECLRALGASRLIVRSISGAWPRQVLTAKVKPGKSDNIKEREREGEKHEVEFTVKQQPDFWPTTQWNVSGVYHFTI